MSESRETVYSQRGYSVGSVAEAKEIAEHHLKAVGLGHLQTVFGLPEVDDRYHIWRVPLLDTSERPIGEVVIDARTSLVQQGRSTDGSIIEERVHANGKHKKESGPKRSTSIARSELRNTIIQGDSAETLCDLPAESVDLVFTSPPYFNARPDYSEYAGYEMYLSEMRRVIEQCHRVLAEGRFFVINVAPVLLRRTSRSKSSRRVAVPFDLHRIIAESGFDFIDDIIWEKPEGAGWATSRGRRFAADRTPLQYKAVPVTEYVLVYRKQTDRLIDWNIRNHPDQQAVADSRIEDGYERTNIWRITPASSKDHPAVFPVALVDRVVQYYSFKGDVVLDPFAGSGTVAESCVKLGRRFVLAELDPEYVETIKKRVGTLLQEAAADVMCLGCSPIRVEPTLFTEGS